MTLIAEDTPKVFIVLVAAMAAKASTPSAWIPGVKFHGDAPYTA